MSYTERGLPAQVKQGERLINQFKYDDMNRPISLRDGLGRSEMFNYDPIDPMIPNGSQTEHGSTRATHDIMGRITHVMTFFDDYTNNVSLKYDDYNNVIMETAEGNTNWYEYDALNRPTRIWNSDGLENVRRYDYRNNLIFTSNEYGIIRFCYDSRDLATNIVYSDGKVAYLSYTPSRKLAWSKDEEGNEYECDYNLAGRLSTARMYSANKAQLNRTLIYKYNNFNKIVSFSDGNTIISNTYDQNQRIVGEHIDYGPFVLSCKYTYYSNGLLESFTGADGVTQTYLYDALHRLIGVRLPGAGTIGIGNYNLLQPSTRNYPDGVQFNSEWDEYFRPALFAMSSTDNTSLLSRSFMYNSIGLITNIQSEHGEYRFKYDDSMRLTREIRPPSETNTYAYDTVGNCTNSSLGGELWVYDDQQRLISNEFSHFWYDSSGNVTTRIDGTQTRMFFYNDLKQLILITDEIGANIAEYGYDFLNRRLWKIANCQTTYYHYSSRGLIGEYDANGKPIKTYGYMPSGKWGTAPLFMKQGNDFYWYCNDHLGTPQKLIDVNGAVVWEGRYDAYGNCTIIKSIVKNNLRLPGQYYDEETGLHYNWNRYYDPQLGRYLMEDPMREGPNLYLYAGAMPLTFVDPMGLCWLSDPENLLDSIQFLLDAIGIIEPTPFADGLNGIIYLMRGKNADAFMSFISMAPYVGDAIGKGGKVGKGVVALGGTTAGAFILKYWDDIVWLFKNSDKRKRYYRVLLEHRRNVIEIGLELNRKLGWGLGESRLKFVLTWHDWAKYLPDNTKILIESYNKKLPPGFTKKLNTCEERLTYDILPWLFGPNGRKNAIDIQKMADGIDTGINPARAAEMPREVLRYSEGILEYIKNKGGYEWQEAAAHYAEYLDKIIDIEDLWTK